MRQMRALLSVYDKTGVVDFGQALVGLGFELLSTGGTLAALREADVPVTAVEDVTGFPEILDGRVKTLHPRIHGGLLARRDNPGHLAQLEEHGIAPIDLLASNLYPFVETVASSSVSLADAIEQIDIGGPAMVRAAAKNFSSVIVVTDPADYKAVLQDMSDGDVRTERRQQLAAKAFAHVAAYDTVVADYLRGDLPNDARFPRQLTIAGEKIRDLRYGENPQQQAAAFRRLVAGLTVPSILDAMQLSGKELSFNNFLDADAAWSATLPFSEPTVAIVKHTIPCGLACRDQIEEAFDEALAGDPVSAFGGIVALNRPVDEETARRLSTVRFDIVVAPGFDNVALAQLTPKKNLRLLELQTNGAERLRSPWDVRPIRGGLLIQEADDLDDDPSSWRVVSRREPTDAELRDLGFAWEAVRHVKSNAIVLARNQTILGVGSGQPNRVESVRIAARKAGDRARGGVLASDAFFPFADGLQVGIDAGITAAVQPGGSIRDQEGIAAADAAGVAMVFTGTRHFRH